jgi:hypothetical protein
VLAIARLLVSLLRRSILIAGEEPSLAYFHCGLSVNGPLWPASPGPQPIDVHSLERLLLCSTALERTIRTTQVACLACY